MSFRYDIGFLRALAVIVVVFFHYQVPFFNGGFVGVDIFFVISGYLMTRIILTKFEVESFKLYEFYERRFIRIVPALIVMIIGVLIGTFFFYFPIDFKQVSQYSLFSGLFLSNYYYLFNSGYFEPSSQFNILLHTWSLSVEWQFYMIYPLFLMLFKKIYLKKYKNFKVVFLIVTFLSFFLIIIFNNFLPSSYSKVSFFSFTHRAWEMMLGGMAFLYSDFFQNKLTNSIKRLITYLCFIGLVVSIYFFTEEHVWPSYLTLVPTVSSFLLIAIYKEYDFYTNKSLQYIGNISYSLYLWHWPFYVAALYFDFKGWGVLIGLLLLSVLMSVLSYEFIEKKTKSFSIKTIVITTTVTLTFTLITSILFINKFMFPKDAIALTEFESKYESTRKKQFNSGVCHNMPEINYNDCLCIDSNKKNILLLGDSHAGQYSFSLKSKLDSTQYNFIEHTVVGSFPLINSQGRKSSTNQFKSLFNEFIVTNKNKIDLIILSCHWLTYENSAGYKTDFELAKGINETIKYIEELGIKIIILGQTEKYNINFPRTQAFRIQGKKDRSYINENSYILNKNLREMIPRKNYVDLFLLKEIKHYNEISKTPYIFDHNHLTIYGANQVVDFLISQNKF